MGRRAAPAAFGQRGGATGGLGGATDRAGARGASADGGAPPRVEAWAGDHPGAPTHTRGGTGPACGDAAGRAAGDPGNVLRGAGGGRARRRGWGAAAATRDR